MLGKRFGLTLIVGALALAAGAPAAYANGAGVSCPHFTASVTSGTIATPTADPTTGQVTMAPVTGSLNQVLPYQASTRVALRYGDNAYTLNRGTLFALSCYGPNKHKPTLLWPAITIIHGTGTVDTIAATPGGLKTFQALVTTVGQVAQRITVHEGGKSPTEGVMTMHSTGPVVDVTPEIPIVDSNPSLGPGNGHCIYPHAMRAHFHWAQTQQSLVMRVRVA